MRLYHCRVFPRVNSNDNKQIPCCVNLRPIELVKGEQLTEESVLLGQSLFSVEMQCINCCCR